MDGPTMAGFAAMLEPINALADSTPGFVWRLQDDSGDATAIRPYPDDDLIMVNLSVWESIDALHEFVYKSEHVDVFRQRRDWFEHFGKPYMAMWWIDAGSIPTVDDAKERLAHLTTHGPTPYAFTFKERFDP